MPHSNWDGPYPDWFYTLDDEDQNIFIAAEGDVPYHWFHRLDEVVGEAAVEPEEPDDDVQKIAAEGDGGSAVWLTLGVLSSVFTVLMMLVLYVCTCKKKAIRNAELNDQQRPDRPAVEDAAAPRRHPLELQTRARGAVWGVPARSSLLALPATAAAPVRCSSRIAEDSYPQPGFGAGHSTAAPVSAPAYGHIVLAQREAAPELQPAYGNYGYGKTGAGSAPTPAHRRASPSRSLRIPRTTSIGRVVHVANPNSNEAPPTYEALAMMLANDVVDRTNDDDTVVFETALEFDLTSGSFTQTPHGGLDRTASVSRV